MMDRLLNANWESIEEIVFSRFVAPNTPSFARLTLLRAPSLLGGARFNVFERRWHKTATPPDNSGGRLLRFRFTSQVEARQLLEDRCDTLIRLGYRLTDGQVSTRSPWAWLEELLQKPSFDWEQKIPGQSLLAIAEQLGLDQNSLLQGIATICGVNVDDLRLPSLRVLKKIDQKAFQAVLPHLILSPNSQLATLGRRWLEFPVTVFELDSQVLVQWLLNHSELAELLSKQIESKGLAIFGPEGLRTLRGSRSATIRRGVESWNQRLPTLSTSSN